MIQKEVASLREAVADIGDGATVMIGGFGTGPRRTYAAAKFLIFGLLGGFVMLASIIGLYVQSAKVGEPSYLVGKGWPALKATRCADEDQAVPCVGD